MPDGIFEHLHYWLAGVLLLVGLYGMLVPPNLVRKLMGLNILQTAVIIFFIAIAAKSGGKPPIEGSDGPIAADRFVNPLPHALMLTAIVVGVSTTGVALALAIRIQRQLGTLEEPELLAKMRE
jgi:multicomponent Na+:H+ antiporter subunit C